MLMIRRAGNGEVVFTVSGQMDRGNVAELQSVISSEATGRRIVLDLKDLILADQDVVSFLVRCEADGIQLKNCPAYIREWVLRERKTRSCD
jgi:anti-anti-sigma regulatory factor